MIRQLHSCCWPCGPVAAPVQGEDADGDGYPECLDCDDTAPALNPGMVELCDAWDNDCDGTNNRDADGVGVCERELAVLSGSDILFVIDDSCSMSEEQTSLAGASPGFVTELFAADLDFHVGVVTTDIPSGQGRLREVNGLRWIDPFSPTPEDTLALMILAGTGGSADERGFDSVVQALDAQVQPGAFNDGFLRADAHLDVVFVSDENEHSTMAAADFENWLLALKPGGSQVRAHSIVSPDPVCPVAAEAGNKYMAVTLGLGGFSASICQPPWDALVADVASTVPPPVPTDTFFISFEVDPTTLAAEVFDENGASVAVYSAADIVWDATERSLTFPAVVALGHTITLRFARP